MHSIREDIRAVIQEKVNGKIDKIDKKLDDYIKDSNEWRERAQPAIDMGTNLKGFGKVLGVIVGFMAAIGASWSLIVWLAGIIKK